MRLAGAVMPAALIEIPSDIPTHRHFEKRAGREALLQKKKRAGHEALL
jgi:hypothetical protein